jgi:hypothetical protein
MYPIFDLSNKAAGESSTYRKADKYSDYEDMNVAVPRGNGMLCHATPDGGSTGVGRCGATYSKGCGNLPDGSMVCPTDGAPFEVFTALSMANVTGDYWQKNKLHHTANGQADLSNMEEQGYGQVKTYHHDLDNTELYFTACDTADAKDGYSKWSYARSGAGSSEPDNFAYDQQEFNIAHLVPPEQQINQLDSTKPVPFPAKLGCFRFFDECYSNAAMSGHGYISFGGTVGDDFTESISEWGKYKMVAALWDDLNPAGGYNPDKVMGLAKNVYAVFEQEESQMIFQWHYIPETAHNYKNQKTSDENVFRIVLDFDTNEIMIKTGDIESIDGIVGISGGIAKSTGVGYGHHHLDFTANTNGAGKCFTYEA